MLGYCIFPLDVALVACRIILLANQSLALFIVRFLVVIVGFAWATFGMFFIALLQVIQSTMI